MANVNCYPSTNVIKQDQPVNSQYIQKILDENVGLIHAIIEKQQQNQEAEDLLKSLHKNLIYLATIADQTTSVGNTASSAPPQQHQYNYPQVTINHPTNFPGNVPSQPIQSMSYVTQSSMVTAQTTPIETVEKKSQSSGEDSYKEMNLKSESISSINVDMDRDIDKGHSVRDSTHPPMAHKNVDIDKDNLLPPVSDVSKETTVITQNTSNSEYIPKFEESVSTTTPHMQNTNIKTDMPPPSQPIGIHQDKSSVQYQGNHRIMYPGVAPNYNQYNPHFDQNNKFYPQNMYQQSPYNYQGMYSPYQPVAPPAAPTHYNQHMMNSPMYQQYPYYQQPGMEQMPPIPKDAALPPQMHPGNAMSQPIYPPNTMSQSMYPSQNSMSQAMHPPNTLPQSIKPSNSESQSNTNITE